MNALAYHEATKHSEHSLRADPHYLDWDNQPIPFKLYRGLDAIPLPREHQDPGTPALDAIAALPGAGPVREPDLAALARVLFLAAGITKVKRHPGGELALRAYPNTGALYHVDLYLVTRDLADLAAGVYHFGPHDFALRCLRAGDFRAHVLEAAGGEPDLARAPVIVASASTYWRNAWKYRGRAWRHCFWDGGTLHANLLAAAAVEQLAPKLVMGFADAAIEALLGLDPQREGALALVALGRDARQHRAATALRPLRLETEPLSRSEVDYPEIRDAQAGSALASGKEAATWRERAAASGQAAGRAAGPMVPLAPLAADATPRDSLARVIRRRGSTRFFDPERAIGFDGLSTALERAMGALDADFLAAPDTSLVEHYLIASAVDGLEPGTYVYRRGERALERLQRLPPEELRARAGRLGLFQELPADAAVNLYALADLEALTACLGSRGYRAAQLEAAIRAGRIYLAAYAQGFGATGLTFLDDEVTHLFSPRARGKGVLFLIALGHADRARLRGA